MVHKMDLFQTIPIVGVSSSKKKQRLSYSITFKLTAVEHAETHGNRATARYLGINEKQIRDWRSKKFCLLNTNANAKRLKGAGRQMSECRREREFKEWLEEERRQGNLASGVDVQRKSKSYTEECYKSPTWLRRWRVRNNYPPSNHLLDININDFMIAKVNSLSLDEKRYVLGPGRCSNDVNIEKEFKDRIQCALALLELNSERKGQNIECAY